MEYIFKVFLKTLKKILPLFFVIISANLIYAASIEKKTSEKIVKTRQVSNIKKSAVKRAAPAIPIKKKGLNSHITLPDLIVTNVEMSRNCRIKYTLKNNSKIKIKNNIHALGSLKFRISGKLSRTIVLPFSKIDRKGLLKRPFGTLTATSSITIKGTSFVTLTIDPHNKIPESNESNNSSIRVRMRNNCPKVKNKIHTMEIRGKKIKTTTNKRKIIPKISNNDRIAINRSSNSNMRAANSFSSESEERSDIYADHGINIYLPSAGRVFKHNDVINVRYEVTRDLEPCDITFRLMRGGLIVSTRTRRYTPPEPDTTGSRIENFEWRIPWSAPSTPYYYIHAIQSSSDVYGFGHNFEVRSVDFPDPLIEERTIPELPIEILSPVGTDTVILGDTTEIRWTMPEDTDDVNCGDRVRVYISRVGRDSKTLLETRWFQPGSNSYLWNVDADSFPAGRYQIHIETSGGCMTNGAAFEITGCDYAVESVRFLDGRSLAEGIDANDGSIISGIFRVSIRWNRIELPSIHAPGTAWGNLMTVRSTITGEIISIPASGLNFDYTDVSSASGGILSNDIIYLDIPFEFDRDDIARISTGSRNIPLEFRFVPTGVSMDTNRSNNSLTANMKILNLKIVDFKIKASGDNFSLTRDVHWPGSAPIYDYNFTQTGIDIRNLSLNAAGGPPADITNVPVAWYIEWRPAGGSWSHTAINHGRFNFATIGASWGHAITLEGEFSTLIDDPGRTYRLRLVVDPNHEYLDSNRINNELMIIFGNPGG